MSDFKSGFIALVGRPNVGKSTLLNAIVGEKVAIVSTKPQTTRSRITGIKTTENAQLIFLDAPGMARPRSALNRHMAQIARETYQQVDLILLVTDASGTDQFANDEFILQQLKGMKTPIFLVLNKIDLIDHRQILPLIETYQQRFPFAEYVPVSALKADNIDALLRATIRYLPEGPRYFPSDQLTDQPERFLIAELIREQIFTQTEQEVPYQTAVLVERMEDTDHGILHVEATIYVERDSQKGIVIGKRGSRLKHIGQVARQEIERRLGTRVYLALWVKVRRDWSENEQLIRDMGYV
ncbi:MAG: GTPase Era [Candidatus Tectomicrobia bacterium]|jgi:GTPase|nr:GTPase Era [Candidatus Tectomicrobia bacterium]